MGDGLGIPGAARVLLFMETGRALHAPGAKLTAGPASAFRNMTDHTAKRALSQSQL